MKTPVSNQQPLVPALSFKLDASIIIEQDIRRVTLEDAHKLETKRHNHALCERLKLIFQDAEAEEKAQREEATIYDIFSKYIYNVCPNFNCGYRAKISPICAKCLLNANQVLFTISDNTITYFNSIQLNVIFNSDKDIKNINKFLSIFSHPITSNGLANSSYMPFGNFPPNIEELKAIFYWHREWVHLNSKTPEIKKISNMINYSIHLNIIHYQLAKRLLLLYHTADAIISHDDSAGQIAQFQRDSDSILYKKFQIPPNYNTLIENTLARLTDSVNCTINNNFESTNTFAKLTRTLLTISNGNPDTVNQLAIMLAKIFIGRPYLKYLDKDTNHFTLIITNNVNYIRGFLMDIFSYNLRLNNSSSEKLDLSSYPKKDANSYYHVTEYSAASLSDEKNIGEFIKDKFMGNIVNIDTTTTSASQNFKALVEGTLISCTDPSFGKLNYRSNSHYIRINQDVRQSGLGNYNTSYDSILCNGNLTNAIYETLDDYELFFLVTSFVNYGIDLLSQPDYKPITTAHTPDELVNEFIEKFCSDTTSTISLPDENSAIEDEAKRLSIAKELGITELLFTHVDTLAEYFDKWCAITYKDISYEENLVKNTFISKYPKIFYLKKKAMTPSGKPKDARGIYGLNFEYDKFINFTNTDDLSTQSGKSSPEEFISYMENILSTYFLVNKQ